MARRSLPVVGYGALWFAGYNVALNAAERHVDAGTAALLVNVAPVLIAVGGGLFLREGFSRPLFLGCAVAFGGVALMAIGLQRSSATALGIVLALVAAVLYASSVLLQKVTLRSIDALRATWLGCVVGTVVTLPFAGELVREAQGAPASALLGAAYLGAFPTAVAFTTWAYALRRMPAGRLGPLGYLVTVLSVLMSWAFLGRGADTCRPGRRRGLPGRRRGQPLAPALTRRGVSGRAATGAPTGRRPRRGRGVRRPRRPPRGHGR